MITLYLLTVWGDVDPETHGPYSTDAERLQAARKWLMAEPDRGSVYRLNVAADGAPEVDSFSGEEIDHDAIESEAAEAAYEARMTRGE